MPRILTAVITLCLTVAIAPGARGESLTRSQQRCTNGMTRDLGAVGRAVGKQIASCLKNHAKGDVLSEVDAGITTLEQCVLGDEKGKVQLTQDKTTDHFAKLCGGTDRDGEPKFPPWAITDAATVKAAGATKPVSLLHDIFGADLDSGVLVTGDTSRMGVRCQKSVWNAVVKCEAIKLKEFAKCKKLALKDELALSAEELANLCLGIGGAGQPDEKGKIAKACAVVEGGITKALSRCKADLDLDSLFPMCVGADRATCALDNVETRFCAAVDAADDLNRECGDPLESCEAFQLFTDTNARAVVGTVTPTSDAAGTPGAFQFSERASMEFPDDGECLSLAHDRGDFSVSFWLKLDSTPSSQAILGTKPANGYFTSGFSIIATTRPEFPGTAYLKIWLNDEYEGPWNDQAAEITSANFPVGEWIHVVATFETDRRVEIFVNLDRRYNAQVATVPGNLGTGSLKLGDYNNDAAFSDSAPFSLSHVRTDLRVLSRNEVEDLYFEQAETVLSESQLTASADALREHIEGVNVLSASQLETQGANLKANLPLLVRSSAGIDAVWALVQAYESLVGPFFSVWSQSVDTLTLTFLEDALFRAQQGLHTYGFTPGNIGASRVAGVGFETADYFPGAVPAAAPRETVSNIHINGTHVMPDRCGLADCGHDVKRPTGAYAAPGEIVTIDFPPQALGAGLEVMVGAHTDLLTDKKPTLNRFGDVTTTVPVTQAQVTAGNPFGGLIYVLVPSGTTLGNFTIEIAGAVRAPMFSSRAASPTSVADWNSEIKFYQGPWAEFVSDKFMFQLPSTMVTTATAPDEVMANWDQAMDGYHELLGRPLERHRAEYILLDLQLPHGGFGIGYPQIFHTSYSPGVLDTPWSPLRFGVSPGFETDHSFAVIFHEFGHAHGPPMLPSEAETVVNLPAVYIYHQKFGLPIDTAFVHSVHQRLTRNQAAIDWMIADNFRNGQPMDTTNSTANELRYQHRGHAKYVDVAMLFGWDAVTAGFSPFIYPWTSITSDEFVRNVSLHVGENIAPLLDFWGVPPTQAVIDELDAQGLPCSTTVLDRIEHYRSIAPADAADFLIHYNEVIATIDDVQSIRYDDLLPLYDASHGAAINDNINAIVNKHYNSCMANPCENGGALVDGQCLCSSGFDGSTCSNNIDDCTPDPCTSNQTCVDGIGSFYCFEDCPTGYMGPTCTDACLQTKLDIEGCYSPTIDCNAWVDGNNGTANGGQCLAGQSGCFAMDVDFQLDDRYFVNRLRFLSDWHAKRPGTWELLASDDGIHYSKVMDARSNASPWRCVDGDPCTEEVPAECCPGGTTQDTTAVGDFYSKWDDFRFSGASARYWRFRILTTDDPGGLVMRELELFGHRCLGTSCVVSSCGTGVCTGEDVASCICADCQNTASCQSAFTGTVPACTVPEP